MVLEPIQSDALTGVAYDAKRRVLTVRFETGGMYEYEGISGALFRALLAAQPHPWTQFGEEVKSHPYRRVG